MNKAFIFPGQGSQVVGMAKDFYNNFAVAKETFQMVDDALESKLSDIIFNGPEDQLTLTANTQPALMAVSMAIMNVITAESGKKLDKLCNYAAGHSLGEYSALCAAGSISLTNTAKLLRLRGSSMQAACSVGVGAMAACLGISLDELNKVIAEFNKGGEVCQIANDNIEGQVVISGHAAAIDKAVAAVKELGYRAIKLNVSAPFHCSLMKPAEEKMAAALEKAEISTPLVPLIANVTAKATSDVNTIRDNLVMQICGKVRWRETLDELENLNIDTVIEIGSGKVLTGMIKKTNKSFNLYNVANINELDDVLKIL